MIEEKQLYEILISEPERGLREIMDKYMGFVYTVVRGKLSHTSDVEECVSDVFYEIFRIREQIDPEKGSIKALLAVIAKRKAIDLYRRNYADSGNLPLDESIAQEADIEHEFFKQETVGTLINQIKSLGEPDSQIVIRKYYFGQSTKFISKLLGIKENTVDKKASRALSKLRKTLEGAV